jgi:folate-binding protein YgfZ
MEAATPPVELDGQYRALREGCGLLERSGIAALLVSGPDAVEFLQGQLTNDIESLAPGAGCYAALLDRKGGLQADMRVLRLGEGEVWLDTDRRAADAVTRHLSTYKVGREVEVAEPSPPSGILSLLGPEALEIAGAGPLPREDDHRELELAGVGCRAVATQVGVDLICPEARSADVARTLIEAGAERVSEAAAEILRVEAGRPRFGHEIKPGTLTQEAGINDRAVSFTKGCYIGQETVARLHYKGKPNRHLRGLRLETPVADDDPIVLEDRELGRIGTAVVSPASGPVALAVIRREAEPGATVEVGDDRVAATVAELPFVRLGLRQ